MNNEWTNEELLDTVKSYIDMWHKQKLNVPFIKKDYYKNLYNKYGRSPSAFEYRMQNISYIFEILNLGWVKGLKPAKHIGEKNTQILERMVKENLTEKILLENFDKIVQNELKKDTIPLPNGNKHPSISEVTTHLFQRDPKVKAWILKQSNGKCELCQNNAPFIGKDGFPYLEVHHIKPLADGGSDTIHNTVALCPNCHRMIHYGQNQNEIIQKLYTSIKRLIIE